MKAVEQKQIIIQPNIEVVQPEQNVWLDIFVGASIAVISSAVIYAVRKYILKRKQRDQK